MRRLAAALPVVATAAVAIALVASVLAAPPAGAAGVTTHGWMAVEAIDLVDDPELQALLRAHEDQVRAGAMFPDAGYVGTNTFGEEAHWQRFIDAYVALIRAEGCDTRAELVDVDGPCADLVAHVLGVAAHGMGDEVWDWLFEPNGPDLDEYYTHPAVPLFNEGGAELQMDVVAVAVHGVPRPSIPPLPDVDLLLQAFEDAGLSGVTADQFALNGLGELVWDLESLWAVDHLAPIQAAMPWMSANLISAPGGVDFGAAAIAGYWRSVWAHLLGEEHTTEVSVTHPAPGQLDVPATGWVRHYQAGSSRTGGGARTRITAVLTDGLPYRAPGGPGVSNQLPAGTLTVTDESTGQQLPVLSGYPRIVPYGADPGEHLVDVQPAVDLRPCHWYRVDVGVDVPLLDARGRAVAPHSWSFRTSCQPGQVVGTVTGPGGEPIEGAWVLPYAEGDGWFPSTTFAITGVDGRFDLGTLPEGDYRLAFVPPAATGLSATWAGGAASRTIAEVLAVDGTAPAEVVVDAELAVAGALHGALTTTAGTPLAGAAVLAFGPHDTWVPTATATTGPDGTYAIDPLRAGTYRVAVRPPGASALLWVPPGAPGRGGAAPVDVAAGTATRLDWELPG